MYKKFEELLKTNGCTAYKVSKATGVPGSTFTEWKKGKYQPKSDKLQKIADYFNVPLGYFYGEEENYIKNFVYKFIQFANPITNVECCEINGADHIYFLRVRQHEYYNGNEHGGG